MNHLVQLTLYTGQQLVLAAVQQVVQRPCADEPEQRQRRTSIKGLIVLLLKTAATGILATVLDACIEYRRRQLLIAAADGPAEAAAAGSFYSLSTLSRAGIAAWKSRLLLAIDEVERQAGQYGIEPTRRFAPAKPEPIAPQPPAATAKGKGRAAFGADNDAQPPLSATMEQLRVLAGKPDDLEAARQLEEGVDLLVDCLLAAPADVAAEAASSALAASTCSANVAATAGGAEDDGSGSMAAPAPLCHICMDREVRVQVLGCSHDLCFQCARRLCSTAHDHAVPHCPFCRQTINGFSAYSAPTAARA